MPDATTVHGEIVLPPETGALRAARVAVFVEDVSRADAPAEVIAERVYSPAQFSRAGVLVFDMPVPASKVHARATYCVRVHVDVKGTHDVDSGDYVSTQSHLVLTRGHGTTATVPVRRV
jgi:uncharacterized lipoprotein YbaY